MINTWDTAPGFEKVALLQQLVCTRGGGVVWSQAPYDPILQRKKTEEIMAFGIWPKKSSKVRSHLAKEWKDHADQRWPKKSLRLGYPTLKRRNNRKDHAFWRQPKKSPRERYPILQTKPAYTLGPLHLQSAGKSLHNSIASNPCLLITYRHADGLSWSLQEWWWMMWARL